LLQAKYKSKLILLFSKVADKAYAAQFLRARMYVHVFNIHISPYLCVFCFG